MRGAGLPGFVADMLVSADANTRAGKFDIVTEDFSKSDRQTDRSR